MRDLDYQEQAQLGLKYIEDSVVNLLTRHADGLSETAIAEALGLAAGLAPSHRGRLVSAILELLVASGRILSSEPGHYLDNPARS